MPLNEGEIEREVGGYEPFRPKTENSKIHMREFIKQLIQHNVRVIERYYNRVRLPRLSQLVGIS